MTCAC